MLLEVCALPAHPSASVAAVEAELRPQKGDLVLLKAEDVESLRSPTYITQRSPPLDLINRNLARSRVRR